MRLVALLPMKAHSERVKGKNFKELAGKPLFRWMLDTLLSIDSIDQIVINTDAREVLEKNGLVESERVLIRDRKPELQGDMVSMNRIIEDDITAVESDVYLMTHTTNPLISSTTLTAAVEAYKNNVKSDSLFAVNRVQTRFYRENLSPVNHDPDNLVRTQDLETWFEENSCLYLFTKASFARTGARIGAEPMMYETPRLESVDIDEPSDWVLAEALAKHIHS